MKSLLAITVIGLLGAFTRPADAYTIPPKPATAILDGANLLTPGDRVEIEALRPPVTVVTITSLAAHGADRAHLEDLVGTWFTHWRLAPRDILLVVSSSDRTARIHLGPAWGHGHDGDARHIMDTIMIPAFKANAHARGIRDGAKALSQLPTSSRSGESSFPVLPIILLVFFVPIATIVGYELVSRGSSSSSGDGGSCDGGSSSGSSDSGGGSGGGASGDW